jgi:uncharacterized phage protein (TIGR01671 family)
MREIIFRGINKTNIENKKMFVYGYFWKNSFASYISYFDEDIKQWYDVEVIPETVGQFTGLKDKNGVKVFEGDKVKFGKDTATIEYDEKAYQYIFWCKLHKQWYGLTFLTGYEDLEVIGNIHDNKNLLENRND